MNRQQGVSMIEILITIVVMSFGFLSLASFQMGTLSHLAGSQQHFLATSLASSIGETIRANVTTSNVNSYGKPDAEISLKGFTTDCNDTGVTCSIVELDIFAWRNSLRQAFNEDLQGVDATISIQGVTDGSAYSPDLLDAYAVITITWDEKAGKMISASQEQRYQLRVPL